MTEKYKNTKKSSRNHKRIPIFSITMSVALVAVVIFGILVLFNTSRGDKTKDEAETSDTKTDNGKEDKNTAAVSDKDTDSDNSNGNDAKDAYEQERKTSDTKTNDNGKKVAIPYVYINQNDKIVIVGARITNFKEEGGSCTYTISKGSESKSYTKEVIPDAKATVCEALQLNKDELSSGEWSVIVRYESSTAEGQSEVQKFEF